MTRQSTTQIFANTLCRSLCRPSASMTLSDDEIERMLRLKDDMERTMRKPTYPMAATSCWRRVAVQERGHRTGGDTCAGRGGAPFSVP